jgi:hypothetical protein
MSAKRAALIKSAELRASLNKKGFVPRVDLGERLEKQLSLSSLA